MQRSRLKNFEYLMRILDEAEGERDTAQGSFSFLSEGSYVRQVVVSPRNKTSIAGLKTFLATEVLGIFEANSKSKISYRDILDHLSGDDSKKYSFYYDFLVDVFDVNKNKAAFLECDRLWSGEDDEARKYIGAGDIWWPYILMDRLREVVWKKLREFFKLCEQESCSECEKKSDVYFQFIQAVALYEIYFVECIQERGNEYIENTVTFVKELEKETNEYIHVGQSFVSGMQQEDMLTIMQKIISDMHATARKIDEKINPCIAYVGAFQTMKVEFGISFNAMCYLLMVFEAMNVCGIKMRGIDKTSLKIKGELWEKYERDLEMLQKYNKYREKRYKAVNVKYEELMKEYGDEEFDETVTIYTFMVELCKPKWERNPNILRGLELKLGYPVYRDLGGED